MVKETIAVLGAGSWGTAIALTLARNQQSVMLWDHDSEQCKRMVTEGENKRYLPGIALPPTIQIETDLATICHHCNDLIFVVPSHAFADVLRRIKLYLTPEHRLAWGTKGLDPSGQFLSDVVAQEISFDIPVAVLSGPSFAGEVAKHMPTAITVASPSSSFAQDLVSAMSHDTFRVYTSTDIIGAQLAGAAKNVLAIATGISDGIGFGANTRSALMTRGLAEMIRLGVAAGGQQETFIGLAGVGDLVLTCTDNQSRNRRFGLAIGQSQDVDTALAAIGQVVEGHQATKLILELAQRHHVEMPIVEQVYQVLYNHLSPKQAVINLMSRPAKLETE